MINSIKYFEENGIKRFEELENNFMKNPTQIAEYVMGLAEEGNRFLLRMIQETLESMNQMIIESPLRKKHWNIECYSEKQLTTSIGDLKDDIGMKRMDEAGEYILSNWMAARVRLLHQNGVKGCSAEGHVSHILSARMSSRPMGWSKKGATKMSQLRAYHLNGGNMLELVRYQEREMPKAAGVSIG